MGRSRLFGQSPVVIGLWGLLLLIGLAALALGRWPIGFVTLATLTLAIAPAFLASRFNIYLPVPFVVTTTLFLFASLFMGEVFDFYERVWWWDIALHGTSAIGFGLIGFLFVFMLFEGDRFAAPPSAIAFIAFCVAMTIGTLWEVFEFLMDYWFGLHMQKSGLNDTMTDLMIDAVGASLGALSGYIYLLGSNAGVLTPLIQQFIRLNRRLYQKSRDKLRRGPKV
jgi:hypothetical protein